MSPESAPKMKMKEMILRQERGEEKRVDGLQRRVAVEAVAMQRPDARDQKPENGNDAPDAEGQDDRKRPAVIVAGEGKPLLGGVIVAVKGRIGSHHLIIFPVKWHSPCPKADGWHLRQQRHPHFDAPVQRALRIPPHGWINIDRQKGQDALEGEGSRFAMGTQITPASSPAKARIGSILVRCMPSRKK